MSTGINSNNINLSKIFYPRNSTDPKANKTNYNSNNTDLNELFYPYVENTTKANNTGYKVNTGQDLSDIFQNINDPLSFVINNEVNITGTIYNTTNYTGIVFECSEATNNSGSCCIRFLTNVSLNMLVVSGGGGGAASSNVGGGISTGGGGGGGSIIYQENIPITTNEVLNINVGAGGAGTQIKNPGKGNAAGKSGKLSQVTNDNLIFIAYSGNGVNIGNNGWGVGVVDGYSGGSPSYCLNNLNNNGGGGSGGGGGGISTSQGSIYNLARTPAGTLNVIYNPGTIGENGTEKGDSKEIGGNGGNSYFSENNNLTVPFLSGTIYTGNGGQAGSGNPQNGKTGGASGYKVGGSGGTSSSDSSSGENAVSGLNDGNYYYGNGGGGGGNIENSDQNGYGGDGGKGVVMLWFPVNLPFTVNDTSNFTYTIQNNNEYTLVFTNYINNSANSATFKIGTDSTLSTITFNGEYDINYIVIGAGGTGGDCSDNLFNGGGGGQGGQVSTGNFNSNTSLTYTINTANANLSNNSSIIDSNNNTIVSVLNGYNGQSGYNAQTGDNGQGGDNSDINGGAGGNGGIYSSTAAENGSNGPQYTSQFNNESWYFSGGGGGGSYYKQSSSSAGGLGGGGGGGFGLDGNDGQNYYGPNGIFYQSDNNTQFNETIGYPGSGGGGAGGNGNGESNIPGKIGSCGIIILQFTT